jgi:hypothetical protein
MLRDWFASRSLERIVKLTCRRHKIEVNKMDREQFDIFLDELLVRYQRDRGVQEFGDGAIVQSLVDFAKWLAEFIIANSDEILAIITFIISLFQESPQ